MQCYWVKRLFEDDFDGKVIPLFLIGKYLGKFHNNDINNDIFQNFHKFIKTFFTKWVNNYTAKPTLSSMILPEFIWFNSNIKVDIRL